METAIRGAACPEDVFGELAGDADAKRVALRHAYQALARVLHPDKNVGPDADKARALFIRVTELRPQAEAKIDAGTYGQRHVAPPAPPPPPADPVVVTTKRDRYTVSPPPPAYSGDVADLYDCTSLTCPTQRLLFKIARSAADNDLMENEARALGKVFPLTQDGVDDYRLLPRLVESFVLKGSGPARRVNVFERSWQPISDPGIPEHVSWAEIARRHPSGLDFRDWVWMWKRALGALGQAHRNGYVHAAVLPEHLLVQPDTATVRHGHGGKLVDWCYAVPIGEKARAIVGARRDFYPPEIFAKLPLTPGTDLYMLAQSALWLMRGDAPRTIRALVDSCLIRSPHRRPGDAWDLLRDTGKRLKDLVGPPAYRLFHLT